MVYRRSHEDLRQNESVMRWYHNLQQGALVTGDVYLRTLGLYCKKCNTDPGRILKDAESGSLKNQFMDFVLKQGNEGKAGSYVIRFKKVITSWVAFNGLDANLKGIKVRGSNISPTLIDERPLSKQEIDAIIRNATTRGRAIIGLLAFSGLRPESLGNYDGSDALRIKDIEGIKVGPDGIEFDVLPAVLRIRQSEVQLSKKGHSYFTFIPSQGAKYLKDYLDARIRSGEKVTTDSPLITTDTRGSNKLRSGILGTQFILRDVRDALRASGLKPSQGSTDKATSYVRPYSLRVYWASCMDVAEAKGLVSHNWREFWMGHTGDISARYSTNKVLPKDIIDMMRECYKKCQKYLTTEVPETSEDDMVLFVRRSMLAMAGFSQDEISTMDLSSMTDEEINNRIREKMVGAVNKKLVGNASGQAVVKIGEIEKYISDGFVFVSNLGNGKAIMKVP